MNANTQFASDLITWPKPINEVPKIVFDDEQIYQAELQKLFYGRIWHPVAHEAEVPNPGDYKTIHVGELPIIISRDRDGQVHALHNACAHRGTMVATAFMGNVDNFECPYHRWAYDSAGHLIGCPGTEQFPEDFKKENFGLKPIRMETVAGLIFVTLDENTPPLETQLGAVEEPLSRSLGGGAPLKLLGYQKINYNANWKVYRDQDGYHAPLLHVAFSLLGWRGGNGYCVMEDNGNMALVSELAQAQKKDFLKDPSLIEFKGVDPKQGSFVVAPSIVSIVSAHLDIINIRFAMPRGLRKTEVHWAYFCRADDDEEMMRHRLRQSSNLLGPSGLVSIEDAACFQRIQAALDAGSENSYFLKGMVDGVDPKNSAQNDEVAGLVWWEFYRQMMGFQRAA